MPSLLIFIPTYNRLEKLKLCLSRVMAEVAGLEDEVVVHVSDNNSTDETIRYLNTINSPIFSFSQNAENIGGARNILKVHQLSNKAEYSLILGDDDYLLGSSISALLSVLKSNPDIDFFFINTISYQEAYSQSVVDVLNAGSWLTLPAGGVKKSRKQNNFRCTFQDLVDPIIDEVFCGSLMCYVFRSVAVHDVISQNISTTEFGGLFSSYPHTLSWIYSLKPESPAAHLAKIFTVNFWHQGNEWGKLSYHKVVTQGLGFLFFEMKRLGYINEKRYKNLFEHYLRIAKPSLKVLLAEADLLREPQLDPKFTEKLFSALLSYDYHH